MHNLQRAFNFLDVDGDGWLDISDFEQALLLVMEHCKPRSLPGKPRSRSDGGGGGIEVDASQASAFVESLKGSALIDGREPPRIDYNAFILSFKVVDTEA